MNTLNTAGDLQGGIEQAERLLGYSVTAHGRPDGVPSRAR